jgi:hypothetical protein
LLIFVPVIFFFLSFLGLVGVFFRSTRKSAFSSSRTKTARTNFCLLLDAIGYRVADKGLEIMRAQACCHRAQSAGSRSLQVNVDSGKDSCQVVIISIGRGSLLLMLLLLATVKLTPPRGVSCQHLVDDGEEAAMKGSAAVTGSKRLAVVAARQCAAPPRRQHSCGVYHLFFLPSCEFWLG